MVKRLAMGITTCKKIKGWVVTLDKYRSTWYWFTQNPQGGGSGSHEAGYPKKMVLARAARNIPVGESYTLITKHNGKTISVEPMVR